MNGIAWSVVQRMMIDAPNYDVDGDDNVTIELSENNRDSILNFVNSMM